MLWPHTGTCFRTFGRYCLSPLSVRGTHASRLPLSEVKSAILGHGEFAIFNQTVTKIFTNWRKGSHVAPHGLRQGRTPEGPDRDHCGGIARHVSKVTVAGCLRCLSAPDGLLGMQDDAYLIAADGWIRGAQPREIFQVKNKDNKVVWPEPHDYLKGKRRFKSDLVPAPILVARYFGRWCTWPVQG